MSDAPQLMQTVLDARDPRRLAEVYRQFLGLTYRAGTSYRVTARMMPTGSC